MEQCTSVSCGYTTSIKSFKGGNEDGQHFALGTLILNWLLRKGRLSFAQWQYRSQRGLPEARLLLKERED